MDLPRQQQNDSRASQLPPDEPPRWDGDQMLNIYIRDYLHKRGHVQAALAFESDAGLDPKRKVPIDAPQSLLFEWWVVFWEVYASSAKHTWLTVNDGLSEDAQLYTAQRPAVLFETSSANGAATHVTNNHQAQKSVTAGPHQTTNGRQLSKLHQCEPERPNGGSGASPSNSSSSSASFLTLNRLQQRRRSSQSLPQLDLEASQILGLANPASREVIHRCMSIIAPDAKQIHQLTAQEREALAERVTRTQNLQNDAQIKMANLHGLQPLRPIRCLPSRSVSSQEGNSVVEHDDRAGQKRKFQSRPGQGLNSDWTVAGLGHENRSIQPEVQPHAGSFQTIRGVSYPDGTAMPSAPLSSMPRDGVASTHFYAHPMRQQDSSCSAPPPSASYTMGAPPARRLSLLGSTRQGSSPLRTHSSDLPTASPLAMSMSPIPEGPTVNMHGGMMRQHSVPPSNSHLHQQQDVQLYAYDTHQQVPPGAVSHSIPLRNTHLNIRPNHPHMETMQLKEPVAVGTFPPSARMIATNEGAYAITEGVGHQAGTSAPVTPFADTEYEFNVLLGNSTQLGREEAARLARQLGDVGGF